MSKIPTSFLGRGSKLLGLAGRMAMEEATLRLKTWEDEKEKLKHRVQLAETLVKTLSQLKGASMKLGQLLSLDLGDYLPPEIVKVLEQLHQKATFLPFDEIEKILIRELGQKKNDLLALGRTPLAAASIGQVHKAILKQKDVVLKIQYPGVAESIPSDLRILEVIMKQGGVLFNKRDTDITPVLDEVKEVLLKEADYRNELLMHQKYREKLSQGPYFIPDIYSEYCTDKVLTMEFVKGKSFTEWLEENPSYEKRRKLADLLIRLYLEEIFVHQLVQTDPNPGNFILTEDERLALIDFGAVKEYSQEFVSSYRSILKAALADDKETVINESVKIGFLDAREGKEVKDIYLEMMEFLAKPFREDTEFDFTNKEFFTKSRDLSWEMTKKCRYTPPPKDLLFLHRKLAGVFIFIRKLDVKLVLKDYWITYVSDS